MSRTYDRTVHGENSDGSAEVVRYDRAGKWYLEPKNKKLPRRPINLREAAEIVYLGRHFEYRFGGSRLAADLRKLHEMRHIPGPKVQLSRSGKKLYGTAPVILQRYVKASGVEGYEFFRGSASPYGGITVEQFGRTHFVEKSREEWEELGFVITEPPALDEARSRARCSVCDGQGRPRTVTERPDMVMDE